MCCPYPGCHCSNNLNLLFEPSRYRGSLPEPNQENCDYDCYSYNSGQIMHNMQNHKEEMHRNRVLWSIARHRGRSLFHSR